MKKIFLFVSILLASLFISSTPSSALAGEHISQFDTQTTITRDNKARIVETIVYDFGGSSHHGIYRDIPIDYTDGNNSYYLNFRLTSVTDENNQKLDTKLSTQNGTKRIQIGDPNVTITGIHTYVISYELSPITLDKAGSPFLNLDVIGTWTVPIGAVTAHVTLEGGALLQNVTWYGAPNQSTDSSYFSTDLLGSGNQVTINATLPKDYLTSPYLEANKKRTEDIVIPMLFFIGAVIVVLVGITALTIYIIRKVRTHNRRRSQIVVAQYEPPAGMTPAHIGFLQDDVASNVEVTATIINWAVLGYIKIEYVPKSSIFGSKDYRLIKTDPNMQKFPDEESLFTAIFQDADKNGAVLLKKLSALTIASAVSLFKQNLKDDLTASGFYDKDGSILNVGELNDVGAKQWALVDGFRLYLIVVEKDRLNFSDAPAKTPERFNKLLPYAIALGVEKQWAKQFEGIDLSTSASWYDGNLASFSAVMIASDLGGSFADILNSSSSVSSDGGVSGGGFGGGGGGSW